MPLPKLSVQDLIQNIRTLSVADLRVRLERLFLNDKTGYRVVSELYKPKRRKPCLTSSGSASVTSSVTSPTTSSSRSETNKSKCTLPTPEAIQESLLGQTQETLGLSPTGKSRDISEPGITETMQGVVSKRKSATEVGLRAKTTKPKQS